MLGDAAAIGAGGGAVGIGVIADDGRKEGVQAPGGNVDTASVAVGRVGVDGRVGEVYGTPIARQAAAVAPGVIAAEQHIAQEDIGARRADAAAVA